MTQFSIFVSCDQLVLVIFIFFNNLQYNNIMTALKKKKVQINSFNGIFMEI